MKITTMCSVKYKIVDRKPFPHYETQTVPTVGRPQATPAGVDVGCALGGALGWAPASSLPSCQIGGPPRWERAGRRRRGGVLRHRRPGGRRSSRRHAGSGATKGIIRSGADVESMGGSVTG
jgi:hypothetical protein